MLPEMVSGYPCGSKPLKLSAALFITAPAVVPGGGTGKRSADAFHSFDSSAPNTQLVKNLRRSQVEVLKNFYLEDLVPQNAASVIKLEGCTKVSFR